MNIREYIAFFPYERLTIKTHFSPETARQKLSAVLEPRAIPRRYTGTHLPYQGKLDSDRFEIRRIIHYKNSFLPVVRGKICAEQDGSTIRITMMPHAIIVALMAWSLACPSAMAGCVLVSWLLSIGTFKVPPAVVMSLLIGAVVVIYAFSTGAFKFESAKTKSFLKDLFESQHL